MTSLSKNENRTASRILGYLPNDVPPWWELIILGFQHVLTMFPATVLGRDLLATVAGAMGAGVAADATSIDVEGGTVQITRPVYAGKAIQIVKATRTPFCIGLRPNAFGAATEGERAADRRIQYRTPSFMQLFAGIIQIPRRGGY